MYTVLHIPAEGDPQFLYEDLDYLLSYIFSDNPVQFSIFDSVSCYYHLDQNIAQVYPVNHAATFFKRMYTFKNQINNQIRGDIFVMSSSSDIIYPDQSVSYEFVEQYYAYLKMFYGKKQY
jgi:hypothetical protein